jgi:hypothetical protein
VKNNPSAARIMLIAGGAVLLISSFLDWRDTFSSDSGVSTDITGLQGIFCLLIGAGIAAVAALQTFGNVNLPDRLIGFSWNQLFLILGFSAFLITFGLQFAEATAFGVTLAWIASAVIVVGAFLELQAETRAPARGATPPTPF